MDILNILYQVLDVLTHSRQTGSTTALKVAAQDKNGYIIAPSTDAANHIGRHGVSMQDNLARKFLGRYDTTLFVDNYTVRVLCEKAIDRIGTQEGHIRTLDKAIAKYHSDLATAQRRIDTLVSDVSARKIQMEAMNAELLAARIKARVRRVHTIRVIRRSNGR